MHTLLQVDIWSDILCPFCYIGKRNFEKALEQFPHKSLVQVNWHSFQLDPNARPQTGTDIYDYLAQRKGQSREWSIQAHAQVTQLAKEAGLSYHFEKAVIANSFDAHRLIQLAKKHNLADTAEELLFKAYFTEGKDIGDWPTLMQIAAAIGLEATEVTQTLQNNTYAAEVKDDALTAEKFGLRGVPFFVLNNKFSVSGAQPPGVFLQALQKAWASLETIPL